MSEPPGTFAPTSDQTSTLGVISTGPFDSSLYSTPPNSHIHALLELDDEDEDDDDDDGGDDDKVMMSMMG